jgi:hypothetical protein
MAADVNRSLTCFLPVRFMAEWDAMGTTTCGCDSCGSGALDDIRLRRRRGDLHSQRNAGTYGSINGLV